VKVLESLQDRIPEIAGLHRAPILEPDRPTSLISAVLVRVPPQHEFPLHVHPRSEDCFFILSGAGEVFGQNQRFHVSEVAGVWVPVGIPHGLLASAVGVVEIGFQSPPGPTVEPIGPGAPGTTPYGIVASSISVGPEVGERTGQWRPVFAERFGWQYLDPQCCCLEPSQQIRAFADRCELLVVVVRGAVELRDIAARVSALTVIQLNTGESEVLQALEPNTLLLGIRAPAA
jgi:mannose-6-phosphate isomerase-like protein (cupin superfamily)